MTKNEFQDRVKMQVSENEYTAIEVVYMNSDLNKDDFCLRWTKMNAKRIAAYRKSEKERREKDELIDSLYSALERFKRIAKTEGVGTSSEKALTKRIVKTLDKAGIKITCDVFRKVPKSVGMLICNIEDYIDFQTA